MVVFFTAAFLWTDKWYLRAQSTVCLTRSTPVSDDKETSGPRISIDEVNFSGFLQMPASDRDQIADSIKQQDYGSSLDGLIDDAAERVKAGWQNSGYFKVQVSGKEATLTRSLTDHHIALSFHVNEGVQYRLGEITFKNNKVISDASALRGLLPIKDGDIFSREKIATGLDNLRKAYGGMGYINFIAIPDTKVDDDNRLVTLDVDLDEGKQYQMGVIDILGLDEPARQELLENFPMKRGQIYDERLFHSFLVNHASMFRGRGVNVSHDDKAGTVSVSFDFRPHANCQPDPPIVHAP